MLSHGTGVTWSRLPSGAVSRTSALNCPRKHLVDGAQPVGPLGMAGRRQVIQAGFVGGRSVIEGPG
jgi:hypothetical protein